MCQPRAPAQSRRWGLPWAPRRPLSCHSFVKHGPSAPESPARWSGLSLHSEKRNFIWSPSRGTLPPPRAAAASAGSVTSRWRRGTRRRCCCRPLALAPNPARDPAGRRRLLRPRSARAPSARCGREFRERGGAGPSQPQRGAGGELVPRTSARHPNTLGKGHPPSCSADGTVQTRKACEVEPEF